MAKVTRRNILQTAAAVIAAPRVAWAAAGAPAYLAATKNLSGAFNLIGLSARGEEVFRLPLPDRGHAAAAHPEKPEAVAFARRPGDFAIVVDCAAGREMRRLSPAVGRRFYGHGAFSIDGDLLFTTENDFDEGRGAIGVWDASDDYRRIGEFYSGGVGPHDIKLAPDGAHLIVANGGIETHPDMGRAKLNLPTMQPNLAYLQVETGATTAVFEPPAHWSQNSIRHLAIRSDGFVAAALQWQGSPLQVPPLLAVHSPGDDALTFIAAPDDLQAETRNYAGSISFSGDGRFIAYTAPRGGVALLFDAEDSRFVEAVRSRDICGVAPASNGFSFTTGAGAVLNAGVGSATDVFKLMQSSVAFDNHLVAV